MGSSIRYGAPPPDLQAVRKLPKAGYGIYTRNTFVPVRVRLHGKWEFGVLREWMLGGPGGWCVRIETADADPERAVRSEWYHFQPQAVDPIQVHADTGEIRLTPPEFRHAPRSHGRRAR